MFFKKSLFGLKNKLTRIGEKEPLNFFSIVIIIGLDIFVLFNIFQGLDMQTDQLVAPYEKIPYQCLNLTDVHSPADEKEITLNVLKRSTGYYTELDYKYSGNFINESKKFEIDLMCREVFDATDIIQQNSTLKIKYNTIQSIERQNVEYQNKIDNYRNDYNLTLQERQAGQLDQNSLTIGTMETTKSNIANFQNLINSNKLRINKLENEIVQSSDVTIFLEIVDKNQQLILDEKAKLDFWYPLKKTGVEFLFLLPLLILFIYLHKRSIKKNKELMIFLTSHLLIVVSIPILFEILSLLLDVLPFHILKDLMALLEALNLIVVWNYLLIFIGIIAALFFIYIIQRKFFSRERLNLKRISKQKCCACGVKLNHHSLHCYQCGEKQLTVCPQCQGLTYKAGLYCINCGVKRSETN